MPTEIVAPASTNIQFDKCLDKLELRIPPPGFTGLTRRMLLASLLMCSFIGEELFGVLRRGQADTAWIFALAILANTAFALYWVKIARTAMQVSISDGYFSLKTSLAGLSLSHEDVPLDWILAFELDEAARINQGVSIWRLALRLKGHVRCQYPFGQGYGVDELRWLQSELNACLPASSELGHELRSDA